MIGRKAMLVGTLLARGHLVLVYALSYMTDGLEFPRNDTLVALVCASVLRLAALAPAGRLSDRIGRREVLMFGTAAMACGRRCSSR
jgi:MFS family permease